MTRIDRRDYCRPASFELGPDSSLCCVLSAGETRRCRREIARQRSERACIVAAALLTLSSPRFLRRDPAWCSSSIYWPLAEWRHTSWKLARALAEGRVKGGAFRLCVCCCCCFLCSRMEWMGSLRHRAVIQGKFWRLTYFVILRLSVETFNDGKVKFMMQACI